jgi:hypothetical protein
MKVLIIGTGWYGCHLAGHLLSKGHSVILVDKSNSFFSGSSSKNQNRLHLGYHYPRSPETIQECREGYEKFIVTYPQLLTKVPNNYYFIASQGSKITFDAYTKLFPHSTVHNSPLSIPIENVEKNYIRCDEQLILFEKARSFFQDRLINNLVKIDNTEVFASVKSISDHLGDDFNYILNCTYNHLEPIEFDHYELFLTLLYRIDSPELFAYTIMDGNYFSVYPYSIEDKIYTLTSVQYGVISSEADIDHHKKKIEAGILKFIPSWTEKTQYIGHYLSYKTKPKTQTDDRSLRYKVDGNRVHFYGGKITGVFHAESILDEILLPTA